MKNFFIVDACAYLFRSYYAIRGMSNPEGLSTNALYGFVRSMVKLMKDFSPEHLVVVFEGQNNSASRKELYPEYKANRGEAPPDLPAQIQLAEAFCDLAGIPHTAGEGVEADDTMATLARWAEKSGCEVFLCTSDKDLAQMVNEKVKLLLTHKDNLLMGPKEVQEKYGVPPELILDYLAIVGDSSDNIPGLAGFGPKTASSLLQDVGSLDELLAQPERAKGKKKQETLVQGKEVALLSRQLASLDLNVPGPREEEFYRVSVPRHRELREFFSQMGFQSLLNEMDQGVTFSDKASTEETPKTEEKEDYHIVESVDELKKLLKELSKAKAICFDTETTDIHPLRAELVGVGLGKESGQAWYVPLNGNLDRLDCLNLLKKFFESKNNHFFGHNAKYDIQVLANAGIHLKNLCFDTILASYLLNAHSHQHSLDSLALEHFGKTKTPIKELIGTGKKAISMAEVPIEKAGPYCCEDVDYTFRLKELLEPQLEKRGLSHLLFDLELPLSRVLERMERKGVFLDVETLDRMSKDLSSTLTMLEQDIHNLVGEPFKVNSPKQLGEILFGKMGIRPPKKTATGYSTNADVLEKLRHEHPIAGLVLEYRKLEKLRSTYVDTLPSEVLPETGRIHCTFRQSVASTGRLSCQNPNLQNIPIRTEMGRKIREAFRPENSKNFFLSADYSQIELRILAHASEDPTLLKAFHENHDVHSYTASLVFGVPLEEVSKEQRYQAKAVNFGIVYGQQAFGLAQNLGISMGEASHFIKAYFERYSKVKDYLESCKEEARKTGKSRTITGRERSIPDINSKNGALRAAAERLAINTPLQGTAADLIKFAMLDIDKKLQKQELAHLILQIHDELIFEVSEENVEKLKSLTRDSMEGIFKLKVPLVVDISVGRNWKEC